MANNNKALVILLMLGISVRLVLSQLPGFKFDVDSWFVWAIKLNHFNFSAFYKGEFFSDYTPGYLYILALLGFLKNLFDMPQNLFYFILKIPPIIFELLIALVVYKQVAKFSTKKVALIALSLVIFNPALIFNSSIWGQIDSVLTFFMLITVIALTNKKLVLSSIFFGLAILIKPQALALSPLFIIFLLNKFKIANFIKLLLPFFLIMFALSLPFFSHDTLIDLAKHIQNTANEYPYTSINAYNFWGIFGFWSTDQDLFQYLTFQKIGLMLYGLAWFLTAIIYFKKKISFLTLASLATLYFYFLPTRVHERYLYPAMVFLVLTAIHLKSKKLFLTIIALTFIHSLNLYYVYVYYNEVYLKLPKILYNPWLYNLVSNNAETLSLLSTYLFLTITTIIFTENEQNSPRNKKI